VLDAKDAAEILSGFGRGAFLVRYSLQSAALALSYTNSRKQVSHVRILRKKVCFLYHFSCNLTLNVYVCLSRRNYIPCQSRSETNSPSKRRQFPTCCERQRNPYRSQTLCGRIGSKP